jgi:hypothetical protein
MGYPRRHFGPISLEVPPGLIADDAGDALVRLVAPAAPASLSVLMIEASGSIRSLDQLSPTGARLSRVEADDGDHSWPGLRAALTGAVHYGFESGGVIFVGVAECPEGLWTDYGAFLEATMLSLSLGVRPSPTLALLNGEAPPSAGAPAPKPDPVAERRKALAGARAAAAQLISANHFDEAEAMIRAIDADIGGAVVLADLYEAALANAPGDASLFDRSVSWARRCWPEPHTAIEAEEHAAGAAEREARLNALRERD